MEPRDLSQRVTAADPADDLVAWWRAVRPRGPVAALDIREPSWAAGAAATDAAVDAGAGVLLLVEDSAPTPHARALTAVYCAADATAVVPDLPDLDWMRLCSDVRDRMPQLRTHVTEPLTLLAGDPVLAWHTACIAHAAARRTPVLISGAVPHIAALCAQRVSTAIVSWVQWGFDDADPAAVAARTRLARSPWFTAQVPLGTTARTDVLRAAVDELDAQIA